MKDPYITLGFESRDVSDKEVATAAKKLIRDNHPDHQLKDLPVEELGRRAAKFQEAKEAWDLLRTAELREQWERGFGPQGMLPHVMEFAKEAMSILFEIAQEEGTPATTLAQAFARQDTRYLKQTLQKQYKARLRDISNEIAQRRKIIAAVRKSLGTFRCKMQRDPVREATEQHLDGENAYCAELENKQGVIKWKLNYLEKYYEDLMEGDTPKPRQRQRVAGTDCTVTMSSMNDDDDWESEI